MTLLYDLLAMAPPPGGRNQQSPLFFPVMLVFMFAFFYFILFRPQQQREKQRRKLMADIKSGDRVVFSGGIIGIVTNVKEKTFTIKIADNVKIEVSRGAVTQVLEKGELPADEPEKK